MGQQISTNDIRSGVKLEIDGQPYSVVSNEFVKPGKGRAINRITVKNLLTGNVIIKTFTSGDTIDLADVTEGPMTMLYKEGDDVIFMDQNTFEQVRISLEKLGSTANWLLENQVYQVICYNERPISVEPPTFMEMKIVETSPGVRGNTASGRVMKDAILESGVKVLVPIFMEQGEKIKVDTRTGEYVSRVKS